MKSQKLLEYKENGNATDEKPKTETASTQTVKEIPVRENSRRFSFRLELAGNRFSPLHEW